MQNKFLIAVIIALLGVLFLNSAFKNGKSEGGKDYMTIMGNGTKYTISKSEGDWEIIKPNGSLWDNIGVILIKVKEYQSKGYKVIASNYGATTFYFLLEKE